MNPNKLINALSNVECKDQEFRARPLYQNANAWAAAFPEYVAKMTAQIEGGQAAEEVAAAEDPVETGLKQAKKAVKKAVKKAKAAVEADDACRRRCRQRKTRELMATSDRDRVRRKMLDKPRLQSDQFVGDGTTLVFALTRPNPANLDISGGLSATADDTGKLTFATAPDELFTVTYQWTRFTDDDIDDWLETDGSVEGAALEGIKAEIAGTEWGRFSAPDGTSYDNSGRRLALQQLYNALSKEAGADLQRIPQGEVIPSC